MPDETGELTETRCEVQVEWRLENPEKVKWYHSPVFSLSDSCWNLEIDIDRKGRIDLYIQRQDIGPQKTLSYAVGFRKADGEEVIAYREESFLVTADLEDEMRLAGDIEPVEFSPGVIVVICFLRSEDQHCATVSLFRRLWNTSLTLSEILKERKNTDVLLEVMNEEASAHRLILDARCPDFLRQVEGEMAEPQTDAAEEGTLSNVLSYLYSGMLDELSGHNVRSIYEFAHKYRLKELKKLCSVFKAKSLTTTEVCDVIKFAHSHEDERLKESAKEFFAKNSSDILETNEWKDFKKENSELCVEILEYMMRKKEV